MPRSAVSLFLLLVFFACPAMSGSRLLPAEKVPLEVFLTEQKEFVREQTLLHLKELNGEEASLRFEYLSDFVDRVLESALSDDDHTKDALDSLISLGKFASPLERAMFHERAVDVACEMLRKDVMDGFAWTGFAEVFFNMAEATVRQRPDLGYALFERSDAVFAQALLRRPHDNFLWQMRGWNYLLLTYDVAGDLAQELRFRAVDCFTGSVLLSDRPDYINLDGWNRLMDSYVEIVDELTGDGEGELTPDGAWLDAVNAFIKSVRRGEVSAYEVRAAAIRAVEGDERLCRALLELGRRQGHVKDKDLQEKVFAAYRGKEWFQELDETGSISSFFRQFFE